MVWHALVRDVAECPSRHRGLFANPCETFAADSTWVSFPGWPLPRDGAFQAELVIVGQGPFDSPRGRLRQGIDASAGARQRLERAWQLVLGGYAGSMFHRLHMFPLLREVFGSQQLPPERFFFTEAVCCPRTDGSPLPHDVVAQCASLHLQPILAQPSVKLILCLGDDAVLAVTGRYRWEPWKDLHGRVVRRGRQPTLIFATHPLAKREGGGVAWSRRVRSQLAETLRQELDRAPIAHFARPPLARSLEAALSP